MLNAPWAVEWLAEASPKLASTIASRGIAASSSFSVRAMPMLNAAPTAFGRCEAMVLVCGGIDSGLEPITLCRPPEIGSSAEAAKLSSMSQHGVWPGSCLERWIWKASER